MKTLKSLLMLCAGLSFCACSSDNEEVQFPEGNGRVEVKIVPPTIATRSVVGQTDGSNDEQVQINGTYTVTLTAAAIGSATGTGVTYDEETGLVTFAQTVFTGSNDQIVTFTGVKNPTKVTVSLNHGQSDYKTVEIATLNGNTKLPASAPAYGETTDFSNKTTVENLTTYNVTVNMAIPIARLEIGDIKYSAAATVLFKDLTVGGVYLDNLRNFGSKYDATGVFNSQEENFVNYKYTGDANGSGDDHVLGDAVASTNFIKVVDGVCSINTEARLPGESKVYAYNFYGAGTGESSETENNPHFKIYFSSTQLTSENNPTPRYAMITSYNTDGSTPIALQNGKIYKITALDLDNENIVLDESNQATYAVKVTVKEARWTIKTVNGSWAE